MMSKEPGNECGNTRRYHAILARAHIAHSTGFSLHQHDCVLGLAHVGTAGR